MEHYLSLAVQSIFVENMALAFFLGLCSFLAVSKRDRDRGGAGLCRNLRARDHLCRSNYLDPGTTCSKEGALTWPFSHPSLAEP